MNADVNITVWNHTGKKYITEKLQNETRKLLIPMSAGIFCLSRIGASTGSIANFSSMRMKKRKKRMVTPRVEITRESSHYSKVEDSDWPQAGFTHRESLVITITQEQ
jgi:hypothetical protein